VLRIELLSDAAAAIAWLANDQRVGEVLTEAADPAGPATARLEVPFDGTPAEQAALLRAMVEAGHVVSAFSPATSDLEEIFLKVTGQDEEAA
jgi:hypothetical protein